MPEINENELSKSIKDGSLPPIVFLWGDEFYIISSYAKRIEGAVAGENPDFNLTRIENLTDPGELIAAAETLPLMADRRCVSVGDIVFGKGGVTAAMADELEDYFSSASPQTVTVIYFSSEKHYKEAAFRKLQRASAKYGYSVKLCRYTSSELEKILCLSAAKNGCTMHTSTARYLVSSCGTDLNLLMNELKKLCAAMYKREITPESIDALCARSLEANVFDIYNAVSRGDADRAFAVIDTLMLLHEEPVGILAALSSTYTAMYCMQAADSEGISQKEMCALLHNTKKPGQLAFCSREGRRYTKKRLKGCLHILAAADEELKSSSADRRFILERAVTELLMTGKKA